MQPPVKYRIDRDDRLRGFNEAWTDFARRNDGASLDPAHIEGGLLWDHMDEQTAQLYRRMFQRLRGGATEIRFDFRCDAPDRRRLLTMQMTASTNGEIAFVVTPVAEQARPTVSLLDATLAVTSEFVVICAWCKRLETAPDAWAEVEAAVTALGLFQREPRPQLTHGICPECSDGLISLLDEEEEAAEPASFDSLSMR